MVISKKSLMAAPVIACRQPARSQNMRRGCSAQTTVVLQAEIAERWVIVRTPPKGPVIFALPVVDRQVVDTGDAPLHEAGVVELPILVTITTKPLAGIVVPFIGKAARLSDCRKTPRPL